MSDSHVFDRREVLKTSAMALGGALLAGESAEAYPKVVNTNSSPSTLKITDVRVATVVKPRTQSLSHHSARHQPGCLRTRRGARRR